MGDKNYYKKVEEMISTLRENDFYREFLFDVIRKGKFDLFDIFSEQDIKEAFKDGNPFDYFEKENVLEVVKDLYQIDEIYSERDVKDFIKDYIYTNL